MRYDAGVLYYVFPNQGHFSWAEHTSPELFVHVAPPLPGDPTVGVYYDLNLGQGVYADVALHHTVTEPVYPVTIGGVLGYDHGQYNSKRGVSHAAIHVAVAIPAGRLELTPSVAWERSFTPARHAGYHLVWGLGMSY